MNDRHMVPPESNSYGAVTPPLYTPRESMPAPVDAKDERIRQLEAFVREIADEACHYGDGCPAFGSNHGACLRCCARDALGGSR